MLGHSNLIESDGLANKILNFKVPEISQTPNKTNFQGLSLDKKNRKKNCLPANGH